MIRSFRLFVILLGLRIVLEVRGTLRTVDKETPNSAWKGTERVCWEERTQTRFMFCECCAPTTSLSDYPDPYSYSLIQNPNVRVKPANRPKKDDDCSDEILRKVMNEHIRDSGMSDSKRAIHAAALRDFEGSWSVICAPCAFSYLAHAQEYCIHSRHGITCLLYKDG